ncbi:putative lipoprotein [Enhygromyxa salina]|uniref:Putative lipoprotein n=1 Tax=Enhygromyxa salina TaxID=215803 RepID=A0A0C1ZS00_9BACT|nr:hypothetical protein [Enhygromyxa salina]KIG13848.1 putative lipoprotein [Enhygromyxa salina]
MNRIVPTLTIIISLALGCTSEPAQPAKPAQPAEPVKPVEPVEPVESVEPVEPAPDQPDQPDKPKISTGECDEQQAKISAQADERAAPWSALAHLEKNFPDMKVSWLMKEAPFQTYVVETNATNFGRCNDTGCYLFAAPTSVIEAAVEKSVTGETHDAAVLGQALGLPAANFEGPLRMMTLDLSASGSCVRLPVDEDPGVWKCESEADTDCFKFGGYTSGGVPELMVINAPVALATVRAIQ